MKKNGAPLYLSILALSILALAGQAGATCTAPQEQQAARAAAVAATQKRLVSAASLYEAQYTGVSYHLQVGQATVRGQVATVPGRLNLQGRDRQTGRVNRATFSGTVHLKRSAPCVWQVTGYRQG